MRGNILSESKVSVVKVGDSVFDAVSEAMELAGVLSLIEDGSDVCIKPNLGFDLFFPGAVTSPWVTEGVIRAIKEKAGSIYIVESDQVLVNIEKAFKRCGYEYLLDKYDVRFLNMSKGDFVEVPVPDHRILENIRLPAVLTEKPFITVPVMKTHDKSVVSGAVKNQWGCLDVIRHNYHLVLDQVLSDVHKVLKPLFAVCDATIALEGDGPKTGNPRVVNRILASGDIVALDSVSARMMGFDPEKIGHLKLLEADGVGTVSGYELVGEDVSGMNLDFKGAAHNAVSQVELALRSSLLRKLVFETPVLDLMCWGATVWYLIWYHLGSGSRTRDRIIEETPYGEQWR